MVAEIGTRNNPTKMDCVGLLGRILGKNDVGDDKDRLDPVVPLHVKELEDLFGVLALVLGEPLGLLGHGGHHHGDNDCERKFVEIVEAKAISIVDVLSLTH